MRYTGMKSQYVAHRFNKPRTAYVIDVFEATPSRANFLPAAAFSKRV